MTSTELEPTVASVGTEVARSKGNVELDVFARMGMWMAAAESGSKDPNALGMSAALRMAYADRLGFPPHAAQEIHVIKGNLTLSAKICRAMAHQHGLKVLKVEETDRSVTAAVVEIGTEKELGRTTYLLDEAVKNGLTSGPGSDNWTKRPHRMMWARASKRALDDWAPWVTVGVMSYDEAVDEDLASEPFDSDEVLEGEVE